MACAIWPAIPTGRRCPSASASGDTLASLYGVIGALLAMHHLKANGGKGQFIDIALYEAVFGVMESLIPEYIEFGFVRERTGTSFPGIAPSSTYPCRRDAHGEHYVIIAGNGDSIFKSLMHAIGRTDLAEDPRLARNDERAQNNDMIDTVIADWTSQHDLEYLLQVLRQAEVPASKVYTAADIHQDRTRISTHAT